MTGEATAQMSPDDAERIRNQERNKLQGLIESLNGKIEKLEAETAALKSKPSTPEDQDKGLASVLNKLEQTLSRTKGDSQQAQSLTEVRNMLAEMQNASKNGDKTSGEIQSLREALQKQQTEHQKAILGLYRSEALRKAGPETIEALVQGNTKEEIEASVSTAQAEYAKIVQQVLQKAGTQQTITQPPESASEQVTPSVTTPPKQSGEPTPSNAQTTQPQIEQPQRVLIGPGPEPVRGTSQSDLVAQLESITDPMQRIHFLQEHSAELKQAAAMSF